VNLWMKRAIGAAALSGGLLALSAGAASAQDVSAGVSANLGRSTSAEVRVCADGRVLTGLLGSCSGSGTRATVQAARSNGSTGVRARARLPRTAQADVSLGTRRSRPAATASGQATPRAGSARADASADTSPRADASASLTRRARRLLDLDATVSRAGVGLLGSSPFTLVGDPATANLLPTGELTLDDLTGEAPAGIGVLDTGPIASGNQVGVDAGDISPSVPVTVCGNGVGVLGDASASCGTGQPATSTGGASAGASGSTEADGTLAGNQAEVSVDDVAATVPVTASCNSVGLLGDASSSCGTSTSTNPDTTTTIDAGTATDTDTSAGIDLSIGASGTDAGTATDPGTGIDLSIGASGAETGAGTNPGTGTETGIDTGIGVDNGINAAGEISTGGIIAPPPGTTSPGGDDADGPGSTGTSGIPGIPGLTPGSGGADGSVTSFAPVRPSVAGSGALPFTGAASDPLAIAALGLLIAGALVVRATRPAAAQGGGGDR
jgi:hypothetical protein